MAHQLGMPSTYPARRWANASASSMRRLLSRKAGSPGENMTGSRLRADYLPIFSSDLCEYGCEAVGLLDSLLETVAVWLKPYREGIVSYCRECIVRGVLLWNGWERVEAACRLNARRAHDTASAVV